MQTSERSANGEAGKTRFCNRTVDDSLLAEAVEQALGDLVAMWCVSSASRHHTTVSVLDCPERTDIRSIVLRNLFA